MAAWALAGLSKLTNPGGENKIYENCGKSGGISAAARISASQADVTRMKCLVLFP
jgi:hypothetical protein